MFPFLKIQRGTETAWAALFSNYSKHAVRLTDRQRLCAPVLWPSRVSNFCGMSPSAPGAQQEIDRRPDANSSSAPNDRTSAMSSLDTSSYNASSWTGVPMQVRKHDRCCRQANGVGLSVNRLPHHPCRLARIPPPCTRPPDHYFLYFAQTSTSQLQCHSSQTGSLMQVKMHARCSHFGRKRTGAPM